MKRNMTAAEYLKMLQEAEDNAQRWSQIDAVLAYAMAGVGVCYALYAFISTVH